MSLRATSVIKPIERPDGQLELDMRPVPFERVSGNDLATLIHESVQETQRWVMTTLPSILRITQKQFASLDPYTQEMSPGVSGRIFVAVDAYGKIMGIMEVVIDREVDTIAEIDEQIEESETVLKMIKDEITKDREDKTE